MANNELLDKVMMHIEHNEHLWNQSSWAKIVRNGWDEDDLYQFVTEDPQNPLCGTQRCFAGHAAAFSGWLPIFSTFGDTAERTTYDCQNKAGEKADISTKAREVLEIDHETADTLFGGGNDLSTLRRMVEYIKANGNLPRHWDHTEAECNHCSGEGEVTEQCGECGHDTTAECSYCEGAGQITVDGAGDRVY